MTTKKCVLSDGTKKVETKLAINSLHALKHFLINYELKLNLDGDELKHHTKQVRNANNITMPNDYSLKEIVDMIQKHDTGLFYTLTESLKSSDKINALKIFIDKVKFLLNQLKVDDFFYCHFK